MYADEHLLLDFVSQYAMLDGARVRLTKKEYKLRALMVRNAGEIIPRYVLLMEVWAMVRMFNAYSRCAREQPSQEARPLCGLGH